MGGVCSTYGGREVYIRFWQGNLRENDHLEDLGVDGRIMLRWIFWQWDCGDMVWIDLAQDRASWWALVKVVMNFRVP